jgi:hypothetical protein
VSVEDPSEQHLPDLGVVRLVDPESGRTISVDTSDPKVRAQFEDGTEEERDKRQHLLRRLAIDEIPITTDGGIIEPLLRFFRSRETRSRRR